MIRIDLDTRLEQIQYRCFLSGPKWDSLEIHLEKFVEFENYLMGERIGLSWSREEANTYISDFIVNTFGESGSGGNLNARRNTVNIISLRLGAFTQAEGFDISESIRYIYNFQETEKVMIMSVMLGLREEILYY